MQVQQFMLGVVMALVSLTSHGESVRACEKKPTKDAQYLCTAVAMVNPVVCEQIESRESMYYCKAMVANNSYGCDKIDSPGKRQSCLMAVRDKQRVAIWSNKTMQ